jgi:hypothetical protein
MRRWNLLLAALLSGVVVEAQSPAVDGVVALARGDYQRAVEILKPLAEDWRTNDQTAQFFMAGLYDTGRGVPADPTRACALYMRASNNQDTALGREAMRLSASAATSRGEEFNQECQALANIGFENGFEPVTFDLGPGHFVVWTLAAATVTYEGRTNRAPTSVVPGSRFLPLRETDLATGRTRSETRHFVETLTWQPAGASQQQWRLMWFLSEVVRDQVISVDSLGPFVTSEGDAPPPRDSVNVRDYVELGVDAEGRAEWTALKPPLARTQVIESDAERREIRDEALARDRALKAVDWKTRFDVGRMPTLAYVDAEGCGNIQMYGWSADQAEALVLRTSAIGSSPQPVTSDIARQSAGLSIDVYVYAAPQRFDFCSDAKIGPDPNLPAPETWHAVSGVVSIDVSSPGVRSRMPHLRRATVTLTNVVLKNTAGKTLTIPGPVRLSAFVGSVAG